jgi:type VI protein secretion system component Hcp
MMDSANPRRGTRGIRFNRVRGRTAARHRPRIEALEGRALLTSTFPISLTFPGSAVGEIEVGSFDFAGSKPNAGPATPGPLTLDLAGSPADPTLLADLVAGEHLATARVDFQTTGSQPAVYLTYTLSDVVVGSIQTSIGTGKAAPITSITLDWAKLTESFATTQPDGTPGPPVVATWDAAQDTATGAGTPAGPAGGTPQLGLSFEGAGEIPATSFSFAGSKPGTGPATPGPLTLTLDGSPADPTLVADLVVGHRFATVQFDVRRFGAHPVVYLTYTLSDVVVGSIQTSIVPSIDASTTTITLDWAKLTESFATTQPDGTPGPPVVASWNAIVSTSTAVSASENPAKLGDEVTFTAVVTATPSTNGTPTGSVQFLIDGVAAGSPVKLVSGVATYTTSALLAGNHTIEAEYTSDNGAFIPSNGTLTGGESIRAGTPMPTLSPSPSPTPSPTPTPPLIIGEQAIVRRKTNKKGKPVGKAVLQGFTLQFSRPMGSGAGDVADYSLEMIVSKATKKKPAGLKLVGLTVTYTPSSDTATVNIAGNQSFTNGGLLVVSDAVSSSDGAPLGGSKSFSIGKGGKTIGPD